MTTFTFKNEDHTLGNLLRDELMKNEEIEFVAYKQTHPLLRKIEVYVVSESPEKDLTNSIENIKKQVKKLKSKNF